jgi:hypothetical protein
MSAQLHLAKGAELLGPLLESHGFAFTAGEAGRGSGGDFSTGHFARGDHTVSFSVRHGLGLVEYSVAGQRITHEEFLRYSGAWGRRSYPGFGGSVEDDFRALLNDLCTHFDAFFSPDPAQFLAVIAARNVEPNKFKGLAALEPGR